MKKEDKLEIIIEKLSNDVNVIKRWTNFHGIIMVIALIIYFIMILGLIIYA